MQGDLQSWWARIRGREDPNTKIGSTQRLVGQTFMALNGIDLIVYKGEALGIIGGNGAGKSTMLKLLSRVTAPSAGEIDIYGRIASMLEVGTGFNGEMTGRENIYMNGAILGMTKAEIDAKMGNIVEFSEVGDFIDTPVKRYSSGMYVKLAFSVAAHLDSEIMIMDEVLAVGDMAFQKKCLDKMRDAANKQGNKRIRQKAYDAIYNKLVDIVLQFRTEAYHFNLLKEGKGNLPACASKVVALNQKYFSSREEKTSGYTNTLVFQSVFDDIDASLEKFRCKIYGTEYTEPQREPVSGKMLYFNEDGK